MLLWYSEMRAGGTCRLQLRLVYMGSARRSGDGAGAEVQPLAGRRHIRLHGGLLLLLRCLLGLLRRRRPLRGARAEVGPELVIGVAPERSHRLVLGELVHAVLQEGIVRAGAGGGAAPPWSGGRGSPGAARTAAA